MKKNPLVSVITPAYNAEKYIGDTIESILNQTFKDFEFIILNDKSTDNTLKIIQEYAKKDSRIIVIDNEKNLGIAGNRNKGIKKAKGKYIIWQDADDISLPERIEKQYRFMEKNPKVGILGGFLEMFDDSGIVGLRKYDAHDKSLREKIFLYSPVAQPASIIRKKIFGEVGDYNLKYPPAEDIDMSFRIGMSYKFANLQEIVIRYREHPNSATFTKLKKIELSTLEIRKKYAKTKYYSMSFFDKMYNLFQFVSIFIIPPKIKIWIFDKIRNN